MRDAMVSLVEELRRTFDHSFAEPPPPPHDTLENLLLIQVGGLRHALRLSELSGLQKQRRIVPLTSTVKPGLLGVAGVRGRIVPVFSLGALLGHGAAPGGSPHRWLAQYGTAEPMAFAFDELEGQHQAPHKDIHALPAADRREHVREALRIGGAVCPLVLLASLAEKLSESS